jgi:hypothetical protein
VFERLKRALVTSFVGAIALGWVFAQGILHFASIFSAPVAGWLMRREYRGMLERANGLTGFSLQDALPELAKSFFLLLIGSLLLRWLYITPSEQFSVDPNPTAKPTTEQGSQPNF